MKPKLVEKEPICDKCKKHVAGEVTMVVLPNGYTRRFHSHCPPKEDMRVLGKAKERGPFPL